MKKPELIVMLTQNDHTVKNAFETFEKCKNSKASCWGAKDKGISHNELIKLFDNYNSCEKNTFLEVVAYSESESIQGAELAVECKCDYLLGTKFYKSVAEICHENDIKYMPFVGEVSGRPSILKGNVDDIIKESISCVNDGAYGIDLLGYRFCGDAYNFSKKIAKGFDAPICLAGSINNYERLDQMLDINPSFFTIGGAFFDENFGEGFVQQIDQVYDYVEKVCQKKQNDIL